MLNAVFGTIASGSGYVLERAAALEHEPTRFAVELGDRARRLPGRAIGRLLAHAELVLLRREDERVGPGTVDAHRLAVLLETADRLRVVEQLLGRPLHPVEVRPPDRLALAVVVVEQLRRQLLPRLEQLRAQLGPLLLRLRHRPRLGRRRRGRDRPGQRLQLEQPVAQQTRRDAVLAVVLVDLVEQRLLAGLHPLLEDHDRGAAVLHLRLPLEVEERLHLLQPVAPARGAEAVADDLEQIDEDAAAEQVVELGLARAVAAHQPLQRRDLVGGVVVDVQVGVLVAAARGRGR